MKTGIVAIAAAAALAGCCDKSKSETKTADALTVIATRTSVRSYDTSRDVTDAEIEQLLRSGIWAVMI